MSTSSSSHEIDPRGPRFGAAITTVLLLATIGVALSENLGETLADRATSPSFILLSVLALVFAWGAFAGIGRHPYGIVFRRLVRPRLAAPEFMEAPRPPTFAQLIGFLVTTTGVVLHLVGIPYGLIGAAAIAFVAAFLNAVFGLCLGCEMYALLVRAKIIRKSAPQG